MYILVYTLVFSFFSRHISVLFFLPREGDSVFSSPLNFLPDFKLGGNLETNDCCACSSSFIHHHQTDIPHGAHYGWLFSSPGKKYTRETLRCISFSRCAYVFFLFKTIPTMDDCLLLQVKNTRGKLLRGISLPHCAYV